MFQVNKNICQVNDKSSKTDVSRSWYEIYSNQLTVFCQRKSESNLYERTFEWITEESVIVWIVYLWRKMRPKADKNWRLLRVGQFSSNFGQKNRLKQNKCLSVWSIQKRSWEQHSRIGVCCCCGWIGRAQLREAVMLAKAQISVWSSEEPTKIFPRTSPEILFERLFVLPGSHIHVVVL